MALKRTTLTWNSPFLNQLVDHIYNQLEVYEHVDLSCTLVVVPTQHAGRRLKEALAMRAKGLEKGLLPPSTVTPDSIISSELYPSVTKAQDLLAVWASVLLSVGYDELQVIYPNGEPRRDTVWALSFADQLLGLQRELAENDLDFSGLAEKVSGTDLEPERWLALAALEEKFREALLEKGLEEPGLAKRRAAREARPPAGISRILVAGVLDPIPLSLVALERWSEALDVEFLVHGDESLGTHDPLGRPQAAGWEKAPLPLDEGSCSLRSIRDPDAVSEAVLRLAVDSRASGRSLALACADPRLVPVVGAKLRAAGLPTHDPAGVSLGRLPLGKLLRSLAALGLEEGPAAAKVLFRDPFLTHFGSRQTPAWAEQGTALSRHFDELCEEHLPSGLQDCAAFARKDEREGLASALSWLVELRRRLAAEQPCRGLEERLAQVLACGCPTALREQLESLRTQARLIRELLADLGESERRFPSLSPDFWLRLLARSLQQEHVYPEKDTAALDLQGWLEMAYEEAPTLCLAGFNEGIVPETIRGDIFMPDSLRRHLGLRSNADRLLRDRLLLECLLRSRSEAGQVEILVPKLSADGDPLQPSRLLFCCDEEKLVERAKTLFAPLPEASGSPRRSIPWRLRPWKAEPPTALSPSSLKSYLACPFNYYLQRVLRMEGPQVGKRDLDALDFGNLCHAALERLARDASMQSVQSERDLAEYLVTALRQETEAKLGDMRSFALRIQVESAAARLRAAAAVEARQRELGWRIHAVEKSWSFTQAGFTFQGRIDRIDRHEDGRWRILDYKTSDAGNPPAKTHWASWPKKDSWLLPEMAVEVDGKKRRWMDLQLPLYLLALRQEVGSEARAGYFILPRTKEDAAVELWDELSPEHLAGAERCAIAVARAIAEARFWPPAPGDNLDDTLAALFPDGLEADVDASLFSPGSKGAS